VSAELRCLSFIAICYFCVIPTAQAISSKTEAAVPGSYIFEGVQSNVEYGNGLNLDAYAPPGVRRPAALVIHGSSGDKSTHVTQLFPLLAKAGYAWFSVNYHNLSDIRAAVAFIEFPGRFPIEPQLLLIGEDTGVSLAFELADFGGFKGVIGFGAAKNVAGMQNPHVPVTLFHGAADTDVDPQPLEKSCRAWTKCRFESIPHGIHNLENWHPSEWEWKEEFTAILRDGRPGLWKDIVYARPGGLPLAMDANLPEGHGPFAAVVVVHGGGWEAGDKLTYVSPVLSLLSRAHFAWFSIDYRLTPYVQNEEQLQDLRNAIRYVRIHAERFNVNPNTIAILGESAGGQIVTQVASEPCSGCEVQAVVSFYGVYDFVPWASDPHSKPTLDRIFRSWDISKLQRYSPISHAHRGMPPVLMLQGTADELYAGGVAYERRLTQIGIPHEFIVLDKAPHGMENWVGHPEWEVDQAKLVDWLNMVLRSGHFEATHTPG
jgi:acetyl esterase